MYFFPQLYYEKAAKHYLPMSTRGILERENVRRLGRVFFTLISFQMKCYLPGYWMKSSPVKFESFQRKKVQMETKKLWNSKQTLKIL